MNSNVTRAGITRDLEEMHRQGIQGVMIFNAGGADTPQGPKFLSPEWNALFNFAMSELSRLGMEASVNLCDGWDAGGPWIPAEAANKKLTWSEAQVDGPQSVEKGLPLPPTIDNFYHDVAVLAIREKASTPLRPAEIRASSAVGDYCDETFGLRASGHHGCAWPEAGWHLGCQGLRPGGPHRLDRPEPLLQGWTSSATNAVLEIYGNPGSNYLMSFSTNLPRRLGCPGGPWR